MPSYLLWSFVSSVAKFPPSIPKSKNMDPLNSSTARYGMDCSADDRQAPPINAFEQPSNMMTPPGLGRFAVIQRGVLGEETLYGHTVHSLQQPVCRTSVAMQGPTVPASPRKQLSVRMRLKRPCKDDWNRWRLEIVRLYRVEAAPAIVKRLRANGYNVT